MVLVGKENNGKWKGATTKSSDQKSDKTDVLYDNLTLMVPSFLHHFF